MNKKIIKGFHFFILIGIWITLFWTISDSPNIEKQDIAIIKVSSEIQSKIYHRDGHRLHAIDCVPPTGEN